MPEEHTHNRREKDEHHEHNNAKWGFSNEMNEFVTEIQSRFPGVRITSGRRDSAGHHHTGNAVDIGVRRSTDTDALKMYDWLMNDPEGLSLMKRYGLGIIDETDPSMMKKTGATGPHFHIGKDSKFYKQTVDRLNQFDEYYVFPGREDAKYRKKGNQWLINLGSKTGNKYVPLDDPTGERSISLEKSANLVMKSAPYKSSFYAQHPEHDYSKPYKGGEHNVTINLPKDYNVTKLVEDTPFNPQIYDFTKDIIEEQKKGDIAEQKKEVSVARQNIDNQIKLKEQQRQQLLQAISELGQDTIQRPIQQEAPSTVPYQQLQQIPLQSQYQLPELPIISPIDQIDQ